jgi:uncharacterized phage protein (TIGR01671 family)
MKREIKFRAWNTELNHMVYPTIQFGKELWPNTYERRTKTVSQDGEDTEIVFELVSVDYILQSSDYKVMQYTGIEDKNGNEIYEGDIISFKDDPAYVVKWNDNFCCWNCWEDDELNDEGEVFDWSQMKKRHSKHYIIHGNIYQNPDL